jgi:hypothetical protein
MKRKWCEDCMSAIVDMHHHLKTDLHKKNLIKSANIDNIYRVKIINFAFDCRILTFMIEAKSECKLIEEFLISIERTVIDLIKKVLELHTAIKLSFELYCEMVIPAKESKSDNMCFQTKNKEILSSTDLDEFYKAAIEEIKTRSIQFETKNSGWTITEVKYLQININKYNPLKGSSWIPTPVFLKDKKCIINVNNRDNYCFLWSLVACILFNTNRKTKNLFRINDCSLLREFFPNYSNFSFPMNLKSIRHFEESNQICSINVLKIQLSVHFIKH